jgi:hypothetical protein
MKMAPIEVLEVYLLLFNRNYIVRDKARMICDLLSDPYRLQEEREFAKKTHEKLHGA